MAGDALTPAPVVDLFAGALAGGWEGLSGVDALGIELDSSACAIREAVGLRTLCADVAGLKPERVMRDHFSGCGYPIAKLDGLIASPPCQAFSSAGKGEGRDAIDAYAGAIRLMAAGMPIDREALDAASGDERGHLVLEPLRWALALNPRWIALEQVPPVLPLWEAMADVLREKGYSVSCGILSAERYGVPQTRQRAILIASLDREVSMPPPTHQRYIAPRRREEAPDALFAAPAPGRIVAPEDRHLLPWVSMADALGWHGGAYRLARGAGMCERHGERPDTPMSEPAPVISTKVRTASWVLRNNSRENATTRAADEPAPTITAGHDHQERRWVVQTNNFTAVARDANGKRSKAGSVPYERPLTEPSPTVDTSASGWKLRSGQSVTERPSTTVNCDPRIAEPGRHEPGESGSQYGPETVRVTIGEAAALQSFPIDWPWHAAGTKTAAFRAVGNAVPPLFAVHVLLAVVGPELAASLQERLAALTNRKDAA